VSGRECIDALGRAGFDIRRQVEEFVELLR
jgi:hypothetical protein